VPGNIHLSSNVSAFLNRLLKGKRGLMISRISTTKQSRACFLLAGGKSSRMGVDKAFINFGGQTLLDRALKTLGMACGTVAVVGDAAKFEKYGPVLSDIFPGCGPLAGIHAALAQSRADLNLMLPVDMPFVSVELLNFLFAASEGNEAVVTIPRTATGLQPLCAVYRRDFAAVAEQKLRAGKYKVDAAFAGVNIRVIENAELAAAGFSDQNFLNLNTPQDRDAAERRSLM
jgi:molybdenum cofactor guanylyltransferase